MQKKPNILLLESVSPEAMDILLASGKVFPSGTPDEGHALAARQSIHAIVTRGKGRVDAGLISMCPELKVIVRCGVGLDNIDVGQASERGIMVVNAPGSNAATVAEHTIALMLMLQRNLFHSVNAVRKSRWDFRNGYRGDEIGGKTLGILGLGSIGSRVAALASAFGMRVFYWSKTAAGNPYTYLPLEEVLTRSDLLSIHLPLTPDTHHLIGKRELEQMPGHALLINTARGALIDEEALTAALLNEEIGGFAADVLETEPPGKNNPLLKMPNVLITPHSASLTATTYNNMCVAAVKNVAAILKGRTVEDRVVFNRNRLWPSGS